MSGTYLYLVGPEHQRACALRFEEWRASQEAFEQVQAWANVPYPHATFLLDDAAGLASRETGVIANELVNHPALPSVFMGVELDALFLEGRWLPNEPAASTVGEDVQALYNARRAGGFKITPSPRGDVFDALAAEMSPEKLERFRAKRAARRSCATDADLRLHLTRSGLSEAAADDVVLLNHLCNRTSRRQPGRVDGYPMWLLAGWENYEGYLSGEEMARIRRPEDDGGFLALFRRASLGDDADGPLTSNVVERFAGAQEQVAALGPGTLCVAISSI